jgi:hypothetical protein
MHYPHVPFRTLTVPSLLLLTVSMFGVGCLELPAPKVSQQAVFAAAEEVVAKRYPMYAAYKESGWVYAVSPVEMKGGSKTKKAISVRAAQNFTGSYDPQVRVLEYVETGPPPLGGDPESDSPNLARPMHTNRWQVLDYMRYEEQAIYDEILRKLSPSAEEVLRRENRAIFAHLLG